MSLLDTNLDQLNLNKKSKQLLSKLKMAEVRLPRIDQALIDNTKKQASPKGDAKKTKTAKVIFFLRFNKKNFFFFFSRLKFKPKKILKKKCIKIFFFQFFKKSKSPDVKAVRRRTNKSANKSESRSKSRSTSRTRNQPAPKSTLGAKVYTKKDLAKKDDEPKASSATTSPVAAAATAPAKRNLRSASSASSTGGDSIGTSTSSTLSSASSKLERIKQEISDAKLIAESGEPELDEGAKRYDLRRRQSPLSSTPARDKSKSKATTPVSTPARGSSAPTSRCCVLFNKYFYSGYLRFTLKQLVFIIVASIMLLLALFFINSFNLSNFRENFIYKNVCSTTKVYFNAVVGVVSSNVHKAVDFVTSKFK